MSNITGQTDNSSVDKAGIPIYIFIPYIIGCWQIGWWIGRAVGHLIFY